jgi:uncharacterized protein YkwD
VNRRHALASGLALIASPALATPMAADPSPWIAYEARLRDRLADAGGGRFEDADDLLALTNRLRATVSAPPLVWHDGLATAARAHAADLAARGYFEHLSPEGFDPSHRFWLLERRTIGSPAENLAFHRGDPVPASRMVQLWRNSPPHWQNLLRPSHTHAGFGVVRTRGRAWLSALYARPLAELTEPLPFRAARLDVARTFRNFPPELHGGLSTPQGSLLGKVDGPPPVMQVTARRPLDATDYEVIGGPIFVLP